MTICNSHTSEELLDQAEAAKLLGVKPGTLSIWRCNKRYALRYVKIGERHVRYRRADVLAFLDSHIVGGESEGHA